MKHFISILFFFIIVFSATGQYYAKGIVTDDTGTPLYNIKLQLSSKKPAVFFSGSTGEFGIPCALPLDTIFIDAEGYENYKKLISTDIYQVISLKPIPGSISVIKNKLASFVIHSNGRNDVLVNNSGESYRKLIENHFVKANEYPESGLTLNIDRASYSNIRRFINMDMEVPPDAVRIDELLNYFNFSNDTSFSKSFSLNYKQSVSPWDKNEYLLFLLLKAPKIDMSDLPPANLVFLIDVSGSMDQPIRLPLLQQSFKMLVANLRHIDSVSIVVYGGSVGIKLPPTSGAEKEKINNAIDMLSAGGDTPGEYAIKTAYELAEKSFITGGNNRVILATDGDFNVGQRTESELETLIQKYRQSGIYLTCLGVGMGNYKDSKLETLSKNGNGNFAYIDNIGEGEKVLVTEFSKTLFSVADNATVSVRFDSSNVEDYRLIGYDNLKQNVFNGTQELEGGTIGSGHSTLIVFALHKKNNLPGSILGKFSLVYNLPGSKNKDFFQQQIIDHSVDFIHLDQQYQFATTVVMFGELLKQTEYCAHYSWDDLLNLTKKSINKNNYLQLEFLKLTQKARKIYHIPKKKEQ